jgi:hypothetical protein
MDKNENNPAEQAHGPAAQQGDGELPPLPEMEGLQDIPHALNTPEDWDADYRATWQKLQVAERNKMQWRVYALKLRAALAQRAGSGEAKLVAWWRYSYIEQDGTHDMDMYYGDDPTKHYSDNGHPWNSLYTAPPAAVQPDKEAALQQISDLGQLQDGPDHGDTVLRIQTALGCTDTGWISPDVILLRIEQLKASVDPVRKVPAWATPGTSKQPDSERDAALKIATDALKEISEWRFGWDGDCGVTKAADRALTAIDAAMAAQQGEKTS